jgi:hypothetical protein
VDTLWRLLLAICYKIRIRFPIIEIKRHIQTPSGYSGPHWLKIIHFRLTEKLNSSGAATKMKNELYNFKNLGEINGIRPT